jgi:uncharacterized PurR-regulated membrane protein YhhQ (DUF165 family)
MLTEIIKIFLETWGITIIIAAIALVMVYVIKKSFKKQEGDDGEKIE